VSCPLSTRETLILIFIDPRRKTGMQKEKILEVFAKRGLLVRSVQAHRPELFPTTYTAPTGATLEGVSRYCYSMVHPTIGQPLYQMSPVDESGHPVDENSLEPVPSGNKRGFALIYDWKPTWNRIVDVFIGDASSNGKFTRNDTLPENEDAVKQMIAKFIPEAAKKKGVNNEVRTIEINNAGLVGFVFSPSMPSPLNRCDATWERTKPLFKTYAKKIKEARGNNPVTETEFHVFTYSLSKRGGMALNHLDTIR
jgi:hypothetical protein